MPMSQVPLPCARAHVETYRDRDPLAPARSRVEGLKYSLTAKLGGGPMLKDFAEMDVDTRQIQPAFPDQVLLAR